MNEPDAPARLQDLIALAREPSSPRRRELLRRITDVFIRHEPAPASPEMKGFDEVLCALAADMEREVRLELSRHLAAADRAPANLAGRLAMDEIDVAAPILSNPRLLSESDLLDVVRTRGQAHLRLVSARDRLSEAVSEVIVDRGDDHTLQVLAANAGAALSRRASEAVVDRALANPDLHEAVVSRRSLPIDLLNEMYLTVQGRLREHIRARNAEIDPEVLEAALSSGRARVAAQDGGLPEDLAEARAQVARTCRTQKIGAAELVSYLRSGKRSHFLVAMSKLAEVDITVFNRIVTAVDFDALAIICKAINLDRSAFMTLAVLISGGRDAMARAQSYGQLYGEVTTDTAQRTLRFWRVRQEGEPVAA